MGRAGGTTGSARGQRRRIDVDRAASGLHNAAMARSKAGDGSTQWAFLARSGSEDDVIGQVKAGRAAGEGIVLSGSVPARAEAPAPTFARQAMRTSGRRVATAVEPVAAALAKAIVAAYPARASRPWTLQVVAPDSRDPHDPRRVLARSIDASIAEALDGRLPARIAEAFVDEEDEASHIAQAWVVDEKHALVGFTPASDALTVHAGGRLRLVRDADAPSRSALKLEEALDWLGQGPDRGDRVVDLGAAPGGWTSVVAGRGARVTAVDKKPLAIRLPPKCRYAGANAFDYAPDDTVDWILCDVAQRPLDVAKLVAKWARRAWARQMITSFKLPMKDKVDMLARLTGILEDGGWRGIRSRQLFYDRNEVTVSAWLDPKIAARGFVGADVRRPHSGSPRRSSRSQRQRR